MAKRGEKEAGRKRLPADLRKKMTKKNLAAICTREFDQSMLLLTEIQIERMFGLNSYNQDPYGNEEQGLSSFVTSDVRDTIEWLKPQLLEVFCGGDAPVVFTGEGAKDAQAAKDETAYCQYVFERQNNGTLIALTWLHDGLQQKNGIIKVWWDESDRLEREEYKNKTGAEYVLLTNDDEYEIDECTITINDREYSEKEYASMIAAIPEQAHKLEAEALYHIIGYRKRTVGQIKIDNVPPENFYIQKEHNSVDIKDARYCCEMLEKTRSDLVEMGYDEDIVYSLPAGNISTMTNEKWNRYKKEGGMPLLALDSAGDRSREIVTIFDHYVRADYDGDGVAELRHVRTVGKTAEFILENKEVDRNIYHAFTPYINSYKFFGRSVADNMIDLQRAKSQLMRNVFDNVMYSTVSRKIISGTVDIDALLTYIPGGIITKDSAATVENEEVQFVANQIFPIMEGLDAQRAERTGFSKETMGLDPSALANATNPVGMAILSQSQLLVKMIATVFAATGFKSMMEHIRELALKYEKKEVFFDLTGEELTLDPRSWRKKRDMTMKVGIGFAGKNEELATLKDLMAVQQTLVQAQGGSIDGPLINPTVIFNTVSRFLNRMGIKDVTNYIADPKDFKPPKPQPSLQEMQFNLGKEKVGNDQKITEAKMALDDKESERKHAYEMAKLTQDERLAIMKNETQKELTNKELLYKYGKDSYDHLADERTVNEDRKNADLEGKIDELKQQSKSSPRKTNT